jgi:hypothetical protein
MNRRSFLKVLGAVIAAPFAPKLINSNRQTAIDKRNRTFADFAASLKCDTSLAWQENCETDIDEWEDYENYQEIDSYIGMAVQNIECGKTGLISMSADSAFCTETDGALISMTNGLFNFKLNRDIYAGELVKLSDLSDFDGTEIA